MTILAVTPMSDQPITYPTVSPRSLSTDARRLMGAPSRLQRDPFVPRDNRLREGPFDEPLREISERLQAAIDEFVGAGYASWNPEYASLLQTKVHPSYTIAQGRGSQVAKISVLDDDRELNLLAVVLGCDLTSADNGGLRLRARHATATDFEHDASSVFNLAMDFARPPKFQDYGWLKVTGVVSELRMYPLGINPVTQSDQDTEAGRMCDSPHCEEPHPFAPYLPPQVTTFKGSTVEIHLHPMRAYEVSVPPAFVPADEQGEPA